MNVRRGGAAILLLAACIGCGRSAPNPATAAGRLELAALPGLAGSPDAALQAELALVKQARGLPLDLAPASACRNTGSGKSPIALKLNEAFPPLARPLVRGPLDEIYAGGELALSGTIGQTDAAVLAGGGFTLQGGFWPGATPAPQGRIYLPLLVR